MINELGLFSILVITLVGCYNTHRHCREPDTFPNLTWSNYSQLLEHQTGTLLFGSQMELDNYRTNITKEEIYVPHEGSDAICKPMFVYNIDNFRKPQRLMEQSCENDMVFSEGRLYICRPIVMHINVLRRGSCQNGVRRFDLVWEPLHVGCTAFTSTDSLIEQYDSHVAANE